MNSLILWFTATVLLTGLFSWAFVRRLRGVALMALLFALFWFTYADLMGRSKPIMLPVGEVVVISHYLKEGEAIHLWLLDPSPRAFRRPWSMEEARQLRQGSQIADEEGTQLMMRRGRSQGELMFYPALAPPPPPK